MPSSLPGDFCSGGSPSVIFYLSYCSVCITGIGGGGVSDDSLSDYVLRVCDRCYGGDGGGVCSVCVRGKGGGI